MSARLRLLLCAALFAVVGGAIAERAPDTAPTETLTPAEHRRPPDQTFLTFPEWFLVFSPAEFADFVQAHPSSEFPFMGHLRQFWSGYAHVTAEIHRQHQPVNFGYHAMILVIGISTTIEYGIRAAYETLIGRLAEDTRSHGMTQEDRFQAKAAQDYVDFIRVSPWYDFDFWSRLRGLWHECYLWGPDAIRKWERKYALTTEFLVKALYGQLIRVGTHASYDTPILATAVVLDRLPTDLGDTLPELKVLETRPDGRVVATVPRYEAFKQYADVLARHGANFEEIAGNRSDVLVTVWVARDWTPPSAARVLFVQPILTQPERQRVALTVPVAGLAETLRSFDPAGHVQLEHVFDY